MSPQSYPSLKRWVFAAFDLGLPLASSPCRTLGPTDGAKTTMSGLTAGVTNLSLTIDIRHSGTRFTGCRQAPQVKLQATSDAFLILSRESMAPSGLRLPYFLRTSNVNAVEHVAGSLEVRVADTKIDDYQGTYW